MMRTNIFMMIVSLFVLTLMGCTRAAKDVAKLNLTIASSVGGNGSLSASTQQLAHVSINVSGAGIPAPIVQTWDACQGCSVPTPIPSTFALTVPSGSGRLIQILAVYKDSETSQMTFYYGDVTKDLTAAEDTAAITVAQVGQGNITGGRVAGRYFSTATGGPTGLVDIKYNPGSGKLPMIVDNGVIVNGWFSIFMLSGANLQYVVRDTNEVLWGQEMSFDSGPMDPSENSGANFNQRVRAFVPVHIEQRSENGVTVYKKQDAETYVWGYWGPGAVGKRVCTSGVDGSPAPQRLKQYTSGTPESAPALSVSHYINWNLSVPTRAQLTDIVSPYGYVVFQGGMSMSSGCDSFTDTFANQYTNFQKVTLTQIDGNGGDAAAGFSGIFRNASTNMFANVSGADPKVITGSILPGVEEVFNGLRLFKRLGTDDFRLEIARCNDLAKDSFVPASSTDAVLDSSLNFSLTSNITAAEGTSGVSAVICPVKAGVLAPLGVFMSKWNFNMGGGYMGSSPATKLALISPQKSVSSGAIANNVCTPMTIETRTASDTIGYPSSMITINLSSSDGNTAFYSYNSCSGAVTSIQTGSPYNTVYVKRTGAGTGSITLNATAAGLSGTSSSVSFSDYPGTPIPKINVNFPSTISAYECYPISYESWHSNLFMVNLYDLYAQNFTLNLPTGSGMGFYYMGDCTSGNYTNTNLGTTPTSSSMYFKYTGSATTLNLQPTSISPSTPILSGDVVGGNNITVIQPGAATALDFMVPTTMQEGQCQTITLRSTDSNGRTSPTTAAINVNLATTLSGGTFYQYAGCSTPITSFSFPTATTMQNIYFKATVPSAGTLTASSTSPSLTVTRNTTLMPATYSQMFITLPGQTYASGAVTGSPQMVPQGTNSQMTIYLVKYDGQIDTNANGMLLTGGSIPNGSMASIGSVAFTNGVATANFMPNNSYNDVYISLSAGVVNGNSSYAKTYNPATMLNIYMSNSGALAPGGCQLFAIIPESADGASSVMAATNFTISADNGGGVYSDANCSVAANGTYSFNPGDRIAPFFFKQPSNSTNSAITVTPNNGLISTPLNVSTNSTATGTAYAFMFTGRMTSMKAAVCQPYLVSVADNAGRSVVIGADQNVTLQVNSGGGTVGTFDDQTCDYPYSGAPTSISASSNYAYVFLTAMISGSTHLLNASGSPLQSTTSTGIVPSP